MAKDAEGATKTDDENEAKLAEGILKAKDIVASWLPRADQADGIEELRKRLDDDVQTSTTAPSTSSAMRQ